MYDKSSNAEWENLHDMSQYHLELIQKKYIVNTREITKNIKQ